MGVVGYLTPETLEVPFLLIIPIVIIPIVIIPIMIIPIMIIPIKVSNPGALIINDELEPVAKEVARLEAEGVDIIIGLGHR